MSTTTEEVYYRRTEVSEEKKKLVEELAQDLTAHQVVGLVQLEQISSKILQKVRKQLRGEAEIKVAKNSIKIRAIEEAAKKSKDKNLALLKDQITGSSAFILTNTNPFRLATFLKNNKVPAPAKVGMVAPEEVVIPEGNTGIQPGPIISEFAAVDVPTRIDAGQIRITRDTIVVRKGEKISRILAVVLSRLKIEPFEMGLELATAYDAGILLTADDLAIDAEKTKMDLQTAHTYALNLAINSHIPTALTIQYLLAKTALEASNLALNANIPTPKTISMLLGKRHTAALILGSKAAEKNPNAVPEAILK